jgi:hypothetical protein
MPLTARTLQNLTTRRSEGSEDRPQGGGGVFVPLLGLERARQGRAIRALSCRYAPYRLAAWSSASSCGGVTAR